MIEAPCKDCERKGCGLFHSKCDDYQNYKAALAEEKNKSFENKAKDALYKAYRSGIAARGTMSRTPENSPIRSHKK